MKTSGRTPVVFAILIAIILLSGLSISLYLLSQETQIRRGKEAELVQMTDRTAKVEVAFKEAQQEIEILRGKNKDADDKINSLMEELDLGKALRDQSKDEIRKIKEALEAEAKSKIELRDKLMAELTEAQTALQEAEAKAAGAGALQSQLDEFKAKSEALGKELEQLRSSGYMPRGEKIDLDKIVVSPEVLMQGRVLNVDTETEFLIFDMGQQQGIKIGDTLAVNRGKTYLGDVKVSRVQEEMSAADIIPPLSSRKVRKGDQVAPKK